MEGGLEGNRTRVGGTSWKAVIVDQAETEEELD